MIVNLKYKSFAGPCTNVMSEFTNDTNFKGQFTNVVNEKNIREGTNNILCT